MEGRNREQIEADEAAFFANYYDDGAYNPTGWRLRLRRERRSLLHRAGRRRLGRVLSLGCGDGQFEIMLSRDADSIQALDLSPEAIAVARRRAAEAGVENVEFRCTPLADLPWDETFDAIVCIAFLHHVPEAELPWLLRRIHDHLVPGGILYAVDPNVHGALRKVGRLVLGAKYDTYHSPDERELDPEEIAGRLREAGFATVRVGYHDLTLYPAQYLLARWPGWPLYLFPAIDWLWCHSPLARWASAFNVLASTAPRRT